MTNDDAAPGKIRAARPEDVPELLELIGLLAQYEREPAAAVATEADVHAALFEGAAGELAAPAVWCHVIEHPGEHGRRLGGAVVWFLTFSTWTGRHGLHIEDLYVREELRGTGYGKALLGSVAAVCEANEYSRLEWSVLDWNTPAIGFYEALGAVPMSEWIGYRLTGESLRAAAAGS